MSCKVYGLENARNVLLWTALDLHDSRAATHLALITVATSASLFASHARYLYALRIVQALPSAATAQQAAPN